MRIVELGVVDLGFAPRLAGEASLSARTTVACVDAEICLTPICRWSLRHATLRALRATTKQSLEHAHSTEALLVISSHGCAISSTDFFERSSAHTGCIARQAG
jgi:hypothetical protein